MAIQKEVPAKIRHADRLSMGSRVRVGEGKGYIRCLGVRGWVSNPFTSPEDRENTKMKSTTEQEK